MARDSQNFLLASQATAEIQATYDELATKLANATSEQQLDLLELELKNLEQANDRFRAITDAQAKVELEEIGYSATDTIRFMELWAEGAS